MENSAIICKCCQQQQDPTSLDEQHLYCPHHTSDENAAGIGLVHLTMCDPNDRRGWCPDCARLVGIHRNGRWRTWELKNNKLELVFDC